MLGEKLPLFCLAEAHFPASRQQEKGMLSWCAIGHGSPNVLLPHLDPQPHPSCLACLLVTVRPAARQTNCVTGSPELWTQRPWSTAGVLTSGSHAAPHLNALKPGLGSLDSHFLVSALLFQLGPRHLVLLRSKLLGAPCTWLT